MAGNTKERILEVSLELFAQSGYLGTSMSDIAKQLGITKGALYKHYRSKQEILDRIVQRMNEMDYARAAEYEMPETEPDGFAEAYLSIRRSARSAPTARRSSTTGRRSRLPRISAGC